MDDWLTLAEAAERIRLTASTLRDYAMGRTEPHLPATKKGKTWFVKVSDLEAWKVLYDAAPKLGRRGGKRAQES
jgi:hypothetical protein